MSTVLADTAGSHMPSVETEDRSGFDRSDPALLHSLSDLMARVLAAVGLGEEASAGLHLVSVEEMAAMNEEHMGSVGPTDVLSFPVDGAADTVPAGQPTLVGDVLISPQVAASQADGHAGDYEAECRLLVVHGSLHLTGWDHADDSSRESMWRRERELLAGLDMLPPRDPWAPQ